MEPSQKGIFTISLDFELYWGIRDKKSVEEYGENVLGAWQVVPRLLQLFSQNNIHATWGIVGAMICENFDEFKEKLPLNLPSYQDRILSPYFDFKENIDIMESKYLFGNELFQKVKKTPNQNLGTHTFSHYYCLEDGQNKEEFFSDLESAINISKKNGFVPDSIIFPRHQLNFDYIKDLPKIGISTFRGVENIWYSSPAKTGDEGILKRAFRFADYYIKMGSHHCQNISDVRKNDLYEIRTSRWLRPYSKKWEKFDFLKLRRTKNQMRYAAKNGKIFQLWFHPHDIGKNIDENFEYLEEIIKYFKILEKKYQFRSLHFKEIKAVCDEVN